MDVRFKAFIKQQLRLEADPEFIAVGGGSINETYRIKAGRLQFFCKTNLKSKYPDLFKKEVTGLRFLKSFDCISTPDVIWQSDLEDQQILILKWIEPGNRSKTFWASFGEQLAALHHSSISTETNLPRHGFPEDNFMGALPQKNIWQTNWIDFFRDCRIKPQVKLANYQNLLSTSDQQLIERLGTRLGNFFENEPPSPLHGDLWSGNFICDHQQQPVLIDPAVYFGHRSMDLGMTTLFGGFDKLFYDSYHYYYPLPANHEEQWQICNLYPLLIHLNLFGGGYISSIRTILRQFQ